MSGEQVRIWKEAMVAYLKVLSPSLTAINWTLKDH
jgi:hypothetical protein